MSAVFSIDKSKVRQSFASAANTYDGLATLQRKVGLELLNRSVINGLNVESVNNVIADVGCGTGFLTQEMLLRLSASQLIAVDIALSMVQITKNKFEHNNTVQYLCADAECLPLLDNSVDKIVSNLALQWCQNLTEVFDDFKRILTKEGQVFFSTFGPTTLRELKQSWAVVDDYTHVNEFYPIEELGVFLEQAGFTDIKIETKCYQSNYRAVVDLMRELKGIGAHNVLSGRNRNMTSKSQMQNMLNAYEKYRKDDLIPATYEVVYVSASAAR